MFTTKEYISKLKIQHILTCRHHHGILSYGIRYLMKEASRKMSGFLLINILFCSVHC